MRGKGKAPSWSSTSGNLGRRASYDRNKAQQSRKDKQCESTWAGIEKYNHLITLV